MEKVENNRVDFLKEQNSIIGGFHDTIATVYKGNNIKINNGSKITEMDLDDWTLARLFGHKSIKSVKYYRRMSNHRLAEDTRAVRERKAQIIAEHLDGWGEEYEQVR